jgi:hypothetical protein
MSRVMERTCTAVASGYACASAEAFWKAARASQRLTWASKTGNPATRSWQDLRQGIHRPVVLDHAGRNVDVDPAFRHRLVRRFRGEPWRPRAPRPPRERRIPRCVRRSKRHGSEVLSPHLRNSFFYQHVPRASGQGDAGDRDACRRIVSRCQADVTWGQPTTTARYASGAVVEEPGLIAADTRPRRQRTKITSLTSDSSGRPMLADAFYRKLPERGSRARVRRLPPSTRTLGRGTGADGPTKSRYGEANGIPHPWVVYAAAFSARMARRTTVDVPTPRSCAWTWRWVALISLSERCSA